MWNRLPIWFRAIIAGLVVSGIPTIVWAVLAGLNLRTSPFIPWSVPAMAVVLWLYWRSLKRSRPEPLRANALSSHVWRVALLAGGSAVAAVWALFAALRGLLHVRPPVNDLGSIPMLTVFAAILMGAAVAGVAEEAGFRGFMQLPLERAYGPAVAITTTSIIFTLVHLTHGLAVLPFLPFYLVVAVVYGFLTYLTGSILPSMTLHFAGDLVMFVLRYAAGREGVVAQAGTISPLPLVAFCMLTASSVLLFRLLARSRPPAAPIPAIA